MGEHTYCFILQGKEAKKFKRHRFKISHQKHLKSVYCPCFWPKAFSRENVSLKQNLQRRAANNIEICFETSNKEKSIQFRTRVFSDLYAKLLYCIYCTYMLKLYKRLIYW
jgi:hypothetical protein